MKYLEVGKITKTHGLKGEVKVNIITDNINRFNVDNNLYLGEKKEIIKINTFRIHKEAALITFNNLTNINDVLCYIGQMIYTLKDYTDIKNDNSYYYDDLIGCIIIVNQKNIATVYDIMEVPQGIILMVVLLNGEKKLIPFVNEFIGVVDIKNKTIEVTPIEGLL